MNSIYKTSVFLFGVFFVATANAQLMCSLGVSPSQQYNPNYDQQPSSRASSELDTIYRALCPNGCGRYVLASNPSAPNAMAQATGPGQSKLAYLRRYARQVMNLMGI